ncbi:type II toxin-antitoxin system HicB family antitoxin [Desulfosporosinus sp. PR]|uniref:type II toxin-antitoxin system HicB family antitoxin n=1 Tax=Candidatus Desulfosporosinus nitrosoreducens TaxID=3401928 RepID=UPI0027FA7C02|nr:type II toxin-antitoxin system HicB family antitoxin [Desulfosporosinus sp. PR]MDQ7092608.1 type II toxin-antitoxin system HicB family antitoxin [Desulfosporosinus sp. PR]
MKKYVYRAYIGKDEETGKFKVFFPDFPGFSAEGKDFVEAYLAARSALGCYLYDLEKNQEPIPENTFFADGIQTWEAVVPIEVDTLEVRRINDAGLINKSLRIPRWLDDLAKENRINFSQVLREALQEKLEIED